jgi:hypothetical protein
MKMMGLEGLVYMVTILKLGCNSLVPCSLNLKNHYFSTNFYVLKQMNSLKI